LTKHDSHGYSPVFAVTGYHVVGHVSIIVAGFRAGRVPAWFAAGVDVQCVCRVRNQRGRGLSAELT
ncbi:MAG: hypothetical protein PVH01_17630, partial [Desulfobacterales bacterium]